RHPFGRFRDPMPQWFQKDFPEFYRALTERGGAEIEHILPPATETEIAKIEAECGVPLPGSYKRLLRCARGFWLLGGSIQFGLQHPFFHDFPQLEALTARQRQVVPRKGRNWPPPQSGDALFCGVLHGGGRRPGALGRFAWFARWRVSDLLLRSPVPPALWSPAPRKFPHP